MATSHTITKKDSGLATPVEEFDPSRTDITRWRLKIKDGRHSWHYLDPESAKASPMSTAEKWYLGLDLDYGRPLSRPKTASHAAENCLRFFSQLQLPAGHWACEFVGPNIDVPGIVISLYVTGHSLPPEQETELIRNIWSVQNPDGGWGLHIEGESTVFGTGLHYIVMRLLGFPPDDSRLQKARECLQGLGGILYGPLVAKFWMAVLGLLPWEIVAPVPPDLWLLPDWTPISPWRWWVYPRAIYLSMSYIWSNKWSYPRAEKDPIITELRQELLGTPDDVACIDFRSYRNTVCNRDDFHTITWILALVYFLIDWIFVPFLRPASLKQRAEQCVYNLIEIDDENTRFSCIASIVAPITLVARCVKEGKDSEAVRRHRDHFSDFFWMTNDGMAVNVTSGVQSWDTAFAIQAVVQGGLASKGAFHHSMQKALGFLAEHQMEHSYGFEDWTDRPEPLTRRTAAEVGYRHPRRGAWGFSEKAQGYPVSDCTAEALKAVMMLQSMKSASGERYFAPLIPDQRIKWAVDIILTYQNSTGGCSCYEARRGSTWLELLNPAQMFDELMVPYDYPECTGSCLTALQLFQNLYPDYRTDEIRSFIDRGMEFILRVQRPDGSWKGSWGICFTYAAYFTLEALASQRQTYANSEPVRRACHFLLDKQNDHDGGWGEHFNSTVTGEWHYHPDGSQVVQTAWALVALLEAEYPEKEPLQRAVELLMRRQLESGDYKQEDAEGAHQRSCVLKYPNYKFIFPIKALGMYARRFEGKQEKTRVRSGLVC